QMLPRGDAIGMSIRKRGCRFPDAVAIGSVHRPAGKPGDGGAFDLLLQIEHGIVALAAEISAESADFTPRRSRENSSTPAPKSYWDDLAHAVVERHERCKGFFADPVDGKARTVAMQIVHDRQRMNDIAERRRTDNQSTVHQRKNGLAVIGTTLQSSRAGGLQ